ncbi:MAG: 30S ribosomal protein S2 [Patescibacteria group bacterium]
MSDLSLSEMLKAGIHFGHKTAKRHPKMDPFIFGTKKEISVIDLEKTKEALEKAMEVVGQLTEQNKTILFVGSKRQVKAIVKKGATECNMPYINERWIGGLITNFNSVSGTLKKLTKLKKGKESGDWEKYTKKERLQLDREITKLERVVGGIEKMDKIPDMIFIIGVKDEATAIREANNRKIPIIGICDTNANPDKITYPIPANDDAVKSIEYIVGKISEAIKNK